MVGLTAEQIEGLKKHKYAREGISFVEPYMDHFWWKLAGNVPLWVTPNLLTLTGLFINIASTLLLIILDLNAQGNVSDVHQILDLELQGFKRGCAHIVQDNICNFTVFRKLSNCFSGLQQYSSSILMTSLGLGFVYI